MNATYEQIERYLDGKMRGAELEAFELLATSEAELAEEIRSFRVLTSQLTIYGQRKDLKGQLNAFHHEMKAENENKKAHKTIPIESYYKVLGVAASVVMLCCIGVFWLVLNNQSTGKVHYKELRRDVESIKQSQNKLVKAFNQEKKNFFLSKYSGTGFAISREGYLVTSYHIVKNADSVIVENDTYKRMKATVVYADAQLDLALLRMESTPKFKLGLLPYGFSTQLHGMGEKIYTLGYPREEMVYGEGYIGSQSGYEGDSTSYQIAIPVNPGNSGGPLLDANGQVIGLVSGKHTEAEGAAFALKAKHLKAMVKTWNKQYPDNRISLSGHASMGQRSRTQQIRMAQEFVFKIKVY